AEERPVQGDELAPGVGVGRVADPSEQRTARLDHKAPLVGRGPVGASIPCPTVPPPWGGIDPNLWTHGGAAGFRRARAPGAPASVAGEDPPGPYPPAAVAPGPAPAGPSRSPWRGDRNDPNDRVPPHRRRTAERQRAERLHAGFAVAADEPDDS